MESDHSELNHWTALILFLLGVTIFTVSVFWPWSDPSGLLRQSCAVVGAALVGFVLRLYLTKLTSIQGAKPVVSILLAVMAAAVILALVTWTFGTLSDREATPYFYGASGTDSPTFNSFTQVPRIGDEREFFREGSTYSPNDFAVRRGDEIQLWVYVHNNADPSLNASGQGIARGTTVSVELPSESGTEIRLMASISATNASSVEDAIQLVSADGEAIRAVYVAGSARLTGNAIDTSVPDDFINGATLVGYEALDGIIPGCFEYALYLSFRVSIQG